MATSTDRGIKRHTLNMLIDEKIGDTVHCALGRSHKESNGTNESAVHVDMIKTMKEGEIVGGDEAIYQDGKYFYEKWSWTWSSQMIPFHRKWLSKMFSRKIV